MSHRFRLLPTRWVALSVVLTFAAVLPLILTFAAMASSWVPPLDDGYIAMRTGDVFSSHLVLAGQRSTAYFDGGGVQVHHPGPLENYLLALPYALSGFHAWGLLLGCLLIITGSVWVAVAVCMREWRPVWTLLPVAVVWVMIAVGGGRFMLRPWNPVFALVPLVALVFVAAALLRGTRRGVRWMPAYVVLAAIILQAHLAFVPVVGLLSLVLAVVGVRRWRVRRGTWWPIGAAGRPVRFRQLLRRPGWAAGLLTFVLWLPPLVEQLMYSPGNAVEMWDYFTQGAGSPRDASGNPVKHVGVIGGFGVVSHLLVPSGSFVTSTVDQRGGVAASGPGSVLLLLVFTLAVRYGWAAWQGRRLRCAQQLIVVSAVLLLGCWAVMATMSASRTLVYATAYIPIALVAVAALIGDGVDWLAWRFRWRAPHVDRVGLVVASIVALVASVGLSRVQGVELNTREANVAEQQMIASVSTSLKAHGIGPRPVRIDPETNPVYFRERDTLAWGLERNGIRVSVTLPGWTAHTDDDFRVSTTTPPDAVNLDVAYAPRGQSLPSPKPGAVVLWRGVLPAYGTMPDAEVAVTTTDVH